MLSLSAIYILFFVINKLLIRPINSNLSVRFIASFAFVLQRHRAKPIPLRLHSDKGSLRDGAVSEADWGRVRNKEDTTTLKSRRLLPSRLRRATSLSEGGLAKTSRMSRKLGKDNCFLRTVEGAGPYGFCANIANVPKMCIQSSCTIVYNLALDRGRRPLQAKCLTASTRRYRAKKPSFSGGQKAIAAVLYPLFYVTKE